MLRHVIRAYSLEFEALAKNKLQNEMTQTLLHLKYDSAEYSNFCLQAKTNYRKDFRKENLVLFLNINRNYPQLLVEY